MSHVIRPARRAAVVLCVFLTVTLAAVPAAAEDPGRDGWRAGTASVVITPEQPMWMAGYASRNKPSEGTAQDLFAKALALQDAKGSRLVIVTTDLIGIPRPLRESLERQVAEKHGLSPESLLLNASHTHCGPELRAGKAALYGLDADRVAQARQYLAGLEAKLLGLVDEALDALAPARLHFSHARCGFAMNRRLPTDRGYINSPNPDGPVDHSVGVLIIENEEGRLRSVLFGYACHNTTLSFYEFCGDYAGYAQEYLEVAHPGATALFLTGCGGDQNPYPRGTLDRAQQHGRALANAVEAALETRAKRPVRGPLRMAMEDVPIEFAPPPDRDALLTLKESSQPWDRRRAESLLEELDTSGRIRSEYSYPVQVVRFGDDLLLVALAGEVVVDYSLRLKAELDAPLVWVAGYSNDVFGYVPSRRVLEEGGYEAGDAMRYTAFPGPFTPSVEERIVGKVRELADRLRRPADE